MLCMPPGLYWERLTTSDFRTPFSLQKQSDRTHQHGYNVHSLQGLRCMMRLCCRSFILNPVSPPLAITCVGAVSQWLAWQYTCPWTELTGLVPLCWQVVKPKPQPQDTFHFSVCVSAEPGWPPGKGRWACVKMWADSRWCGSAFPRELWPGCSGWCPAGSALSCNTKSGSQLLGWSWLFLAKQSGGRPAYALMHFPLFLFS